MTDTTTSLPGTWELPYGARLSGEIEPDDEPEFSSFFVPCVYGCRADGGDDGCVHLDADGRPIMDPVTYSVATLGLRGQPWSAFVALRDGLAPNPYPADDEWPNNSSEVTP